MKLWRAARRAALRQKEAELEQAQAALSAAEASEAALAARFERPRAHLDTDAAALAAQRAERDAAEAAAAESARRAAEEAAHAARAQERLQAEVRALWPLLCARAWVRRKVHICRGHNVTLAA